MSQELLNMIETVDPADTARLDEIDARVWCWLGLSECPFKELKYSKMINRHYYDYSMSERGEWQTPPYYTRSRDALKAIRPDGWWLPCVSVNTREGSTEPVICFSLEKTVFDGDDPSVMGTGETEELAELHAIIQAIEYDRGQNDQ